MERIFAKFGEGDTLSPESLQKMIEKLDLLHVLSEKLQEQELDTMDGKNVTVSLFCFLNCQNIFKFVVYEQGNHSNFTPKQ